jgi:hypothetical protein
MVRAQAWSLRCQRALDACQCGTFDEPTKAGRVSQADVSRVLRLTLLAPQIVEAVLDGRQPESMRLEELLGGFPVEWAGQRSGCG